MHMKNVVFRQYDIRGIVGEELIIEEVYELARAVAYYVTEKNPKFKTVMIGMDAREHSPAIKEQLSRGFIDSGIDVILVGICTTPMIYFATYTMPIDGAIMITASHNPKEYNGLKICLGTKSLWGEHIKTIGTLFNERKQLDTQIQGKYSEQSLKDSYIAWHINEFQHLKGMTLPIVIDCGNGTAGIVVPDIIEQME